MKTILAVFISLVIFLWYLALFSPDHHSVGPIPWVFYQEGLYLTGLCAIALMSLAMLLATRPVWLERPLGGMDRIYRLHKWTAIVAAIFTILHWIIEMTDDLIESIFGEGEIENTSAFPKIIRDFGEDIGEYAFYFLMVMLVLSLWKHFSYHLWRPLHRMMPLLYLTLVFHSVVLSPSDYWNRPIGILLALFFGLGTIASVLSLGSRIGRGRQANGSIVALSKRDNGIVELSCRLDEKWHAHRPGQFAYVTFDATEGAHPFSITNVDRGDRIVSFAIKALGDYTSTLEHKLKKGDLVKVEGPYGRFELSRTGKHAHQVWVAGGIGITPFLAWLDSLQKEQTTGISADLHYSVQNIDTDPFVDRIECLCAEMPEVRLYLYDKNTRPLTAEALVAGYDKTKKIEVWFCGPRNFADNLHQRLNQICSRSVLFHQEVFEMR